MLNVVVRIKYVCNIKDITINSVDGDIHEAMAHRTRHHHIDLILPILHGLNASGETRVQLFQSSHPQSVPLRHISCSDIELVVRYLFRKVGNIEDDSSLLNYHITVTLVNVLNLSHLRMGGLK